MKIAVMQPYFLPYIGYFHLLQASDEFIFFDDVNFIKKGWINRNNFLVQDKPHLFTVNLFKTSQHKLIKDVKISYAENWVDNFLKLIIYNYSKAKNFNTIFQLLKTEIDKKVESICDLNISLIMVICDYLELNKSFKRSSEITYDHTGHGADKILSICSLRKATTYINAIGGIELYDKNAFAFKNIQLNFIKSQPTIYKQTNKTFVPNLSFLDTLMFCDVEEVKYLLSKYTLE